MTNIKARLLEAEAKAAQLFKSVEENRLIVSGKSEKEINEAIFKLAYDLYGIEKYWHKRIVRSGKNTLLPYQENPPNLIVEEDDILFLDFGPIFDDYEADFGRTYVIGNDPRKLALQRDVEDAWNEAREWYLQHTYVTGAEFYKYLHTLANRLGWEFGGKIGGHLIGKFPHETIKDNQYQLYVHPQNHNDMMAPDSKGNPPHWILEIHLIDPEQQRGAFFEQLMV